MLEERREAPWKPSWCKMSKASIFYNFCQHRTFLFSNNSLKMNWVFAIHPSISSQPKSYVNQIILIWNWSLWQLLNSLVLIVLSFKNKTFFNRNIPPPPFNQKENIHFLLSTHRSLENSPYTWSNIFS